jgi:TPR repeat protein
MAESGNPYGQYMLGNRYETGFGVPQDYANAADWYRKASEQGYAAAQYSLGLLYEHKEGVPRNFKKAYFWLNLAASAYSEEKEGHSLQLEVVSARESAGEHLTRAELVQIQKQTAKFLATHPKSY